MVPVTVLSTDVTIGQCIRSKAKSLFSQLRMVTVLLLLLWLPASTMTATGKSKSTAAVAVRIPSGLAGTWSGNVSYSPMGPRSKQLPGGGASFLEISTPGVDGDFFLRQLAFDQLFRIPATHGSAVQYCSLGATAPFEVSPSAKPTELMICWRGPRLPSHAPNCTGCDCVQWILRVDGDRLTSTVLMSPPAIHAKYELTRSGPPVKPGILAVWARTQWKNGCAIGGNHTIPDFPRVLPPPLPAPHASKMAGQLACPFHSKGDGTGAGAPPLTDGAAASQQMTRPIAGVSGCAILNEQLGVKFEYTVSTLPCSPSPCKVTFNLSMAATASEYVAFGFKERLAAYHDSTGDQPVPEIPQYWGMATARNFSTPLSGRIVAARVGCAPQHLQADAYVGSVIDVPDDGFLNVSATAVDGRASMVITALLAVPGATAAAQGASLAMQRVMWAVGPVTPAAGCTAAALGYHFGARSVVALGFPGATVPCTGR